MKHYAESGVSIEDGDHFVDSIKSICESTYTPNVISGVGGFASIYKLPFSNKMLVAGTDGVGSKIKLAERFNDFADIGIDLVAMVMNDIAVTGAKPLFFQNYYAVNSLAGNESRSKIILKGISRGCKQAGCSLVGGETAEMPSVYPGKHDFDLAGFGVGLLSKKHFIGSHRVTVGDVIIGVSSSGCHSNGYTIINQIKKLGQEFLTPTKIYVSLIAGILKKFGSKRFHAAAHITGGGIVANTNRVVPDEMLAEINTTSWDFPSEFVHIQKNTGMSTDEMLEVFNCGIGLTLVVNAKFADEIFDFCVNYGHTAYMIGKIV